MDEQEMKIVEAMSKYGGSFVKALAEAYRRGDARNRGRLRVTFAEYWETYKEMIDE